MTRRYSLSYAQDNLPEIVQQMDEDGPVELTDKGEAVAVLVSCEDFKQYKRHTPNRRMANGDLWEAIQEFRAVMEREGLYYDGVFDNVRDRSPGREIEL